MSQSKGSRTINRFFCPFFLLFFLSFFLKKRKRGVYQYAFQLYICHLRSILSRLQAVLIAAVGQTNDNPPTVSDQCHKITPYQTKCDSVRVSPFTISHRYLAYFIGLPRQVHRTLLHQYIGGKGTDQKRYTERKKKKKKDLCPSFPHL